MNNIPFIICILSMVSFVSCGNKETATREPQSTLYLTDSLLQVVSVETIQLVHLQDELQLNGRVAFNPSEVAPVYPLYGGRVTKVFAEIGDYVKKGQPLAVIRSSEIADIEKEKNEAGHQLLLARRTLEMTKDLFDAEMASQPDLLLAQQELAAAEGEVNRLKELYEINHIGADYSYTIVSPLSGFVAEKNIGRDRILPADPEEPAFLVSGLDEVWIIADVYESDISKIEKGAPVRITTLAYKDKEFTGIIENISTMLDSESKTMQVRVRLKNEDYLLKPGLFTNVYVGLNTREEVMARVPARAVIFENGRNYVVKIESDQSLTTQEVAVYKQVGDWIYLRAGLEEGNRIIHTNALLVYNAIK